MSSYTRHPDSHTHGLADDCPRCAEHADDPFASLDPENLTKLYDRTVQWMNDDSLPRSDTELMAMRVVETTIYRIEKLQQIGVL